MTKIAMWSGPRSISTALMRSFENRPDTFVTDEPFYAHYLQKTRIDHPLREEVIACSNTDWNSVSHEITGSIPEGKEIWYQKHMAQHNLPRKNLKWVKKMQNCLLIRHPQEVILSYSKKYEITSIFQLGYPQQIELFTMLTDMGIPPHILDARDVLKNPDQMLKQLCKLLNIPFYNEMLSWPGGKRKSDGIWGRHWYGSVEASTGFHSYVDKKANLPSKYQDIYTVCLESYKQLYSHRIKRYSNNTDKIIIQNIKQEM